MQKGLVRGNLYSIINRLMAAFSRCNVVPGGRERRVFRGENIQLHLALVWIFQSYVSCLSKETETAFPQQINTVHRLDFMKVPLHKQEMTYEWFFNIPTQYS